MGFKETLYVVFLSAMIMLPIIGLIGKFVLKWVKEGYEREGGEVSK